MVHTLVFFFEQGGISGIQAVVVLPFAFTYLLVGADLDENGPRR